MFTYSSLRIISSTPIDKIARHFDEIGAARNSRGAYSLGNIEIRVTTCEAGTFAGFSIPRHEISVTGERDAAERFLTEFRLRFLSLGG